MPSMRSRHEPLAVSECADNGQQNCPARGAPPCLSLTRGAQTASACPSTSRSVRFTNPLRTGTEHGSSGDFGVVEGPCTRGFRAALMARGERASVPSSPSDLLHAFFFISLSTSAPHTPDQMTSQIPVALPTASVSGRTSDDVPQSTTSTATPCKAAAKCGVSSSISLPFPSTTKGLTNDPAETAAAPPDGGLWAWLSVLGVSLVLASCMGVLSAQGVLQDFYKQVGLDLATFRNE